MDLVTNNINQSGRDAHLEGPWDDRDNYFEARLEAGMDSEGVEGQRSEIFETRGRSS